MSNMSDVLSVLLLVVILCGIATHLYNAKQEKVLKVELER